ncbi:MAG: hypothetical protein K2P57_03890 [Burkholderiales bacterium]|nr:hypothetical protein [Burkholderiales bacterium]
MQDLITENRIARAFALFMLVYCSSAGALEIGALQVESHLGEAFRGIIPVTSTPEEGVSSSCISLDPGTAENSVYQLKNAKLAVETSGGRQIIKISTGQSINEPIVTLQLHIHCSNQGEIGKTFTVFLDPATLTPPAPPEVPLVAPPAPAQQVRDSKPKGSEIRIKAHDTLSGIAYDLYPDDRRARRQFITSVLRENPGLVPDRLQVGSVLNIPDLKSQAVSPKPQRERNAPERKSAPAKAAAKAKPEFHLDIVSGESKTGTSAAQDLKRTETQLITRTDDQTVQLRQLKDQVKSLEARLTELQNRIAVANKLLSRIDAVKPQPREEEKQVPKYVWIVAILALLSVAGGGYWYFRKRKADEQEALMDQYLNPAPSKPALADHLDYFESDTPDHHKW